MKPLQNDMDLIHLISNGDRDAFAQLYKTHSNNLYRFIFSICYDKELTEEIIQDLFLKVWEDRENMLHITTLKAYLFKCAKNQLLNQLKRKKTEEKVMEVVIRNTDMFHYATEDKLAYREYYSVAMEAVDLLPEKRKQIFKLRVNDNLSLDDIACHLQISKSVVKKQLYSGISFVRKYLNKHGEMVILLFSWTGYGRWK